MAIISTVTNTHSNTSNCLNIWPISFWYQWLKSSFQAHTVLISLNGRLTMDITKVTFTYQLVHTSACIHRDMKHAGSLESMKDAQLQLLECSPNFPSASYLDERTDDVWTNCFITFSTPWKIFFLRGFVCWHQECAQ